MKIITLIAAIMVIGWYGNNLYQQHGLAFVQNSPSGLVPAENLKCVTKDGSVIYGNVPHGIECERMEIIEGSLTVVRGESPSSSKRENIRVSSFKCDGRTHCSQMASCDEAFFFLRNCPGVKMDGDNNGIPCERQWCK